MVLVHVPGCGDWDHPGGQDRAPPHTLSPALGRIQPEHDHGQVWLQDGRPGKVYSTDIFVLCYILFCILRYPSKIVFNGCTYSVETHQLLSVSWRVSTELVKPLHNPSVWTT